MSAAPVLVWFRRDLRLTDNQALTAAAASGSALVACYVHDERGGRAAGGASRWWLHRSLVALSRDLEKLGGRLLLRSGVAGAAVADLARELGATTVFASELPTPAGLAADRATAAELAESGIAFERLPGALLYGRDPVRTRSGEPYRVFTPFWKACAELPEPGRPSAVPDGLEFLDASVAFDDLEDWQLEPRQPNWAAGFDERWRPGEHGALARLEQFLDGGMAEYADARNRPDTESTSALSPHLAFGEIGPRQLWHAVMARAAGRPDAERGADAWLRQLVWREFSYYLLYHWPHLPSSPFREAFAEFPWADDDEALMRWQNGITGYPFVDAGMRELWQTGWMHNRVRMVVASFLVKDLLISWQAGEKWFWDTLVDADLANNSASWQWVAGCGADAAPYFRVFNPVTQGERFDPDGRYVRRWVPELEAVPDRYLHAPWTAPRDALDAAGIVLGRDYPEPVVDHDEARNRALAAHRAIRR